MSTRATSTTNKPKRLAKRRNRPLQSNTASSTTKVSPPLPKEGVNKENQKEQSSGLAKPGKTHNKTTATTTSTKQTKTTAIPSRTQQAAPPLSLKSQPRGAHSASRKVIELLSSSSSSEEERGISDDTDFDSDSGSDSETGRMDMNSSTSAAKKHVKEEEEEEDPEVEALNKQFAKMKSPSDHVSSSVKSQGRPPAVPVVAAASKQTTTITAAMKPKPNPVALFANKASTPPTPSTSSTSSSMQQHPTSVSHTAAVIPIFAATTNPKNIPRMSAAEIKAAVRAQNMAQLQQQQQKQQPKQQSELSLPSAHFSSGSGSASSASSFSVIPSTGVSDSLDSTDELEKVFERLQLSTTTTFLEKKKMQTAKKSSSEEEENGDTEGEDGEVEDENEEDDARLQPPRLKVTLLPHQRDALKWFLVNEAPESKVKGGILADDMGLGKTVQMISLMLANQPTDNVPEDQRGTLVVCTVSTLNQWYSELQERVRKGTFNVSIYHGSSKKRLQASLEEYDVVLTTYGTLAAEYVPSPDEKSKKKTAAKKTTTTRRRKKASPLYNMCWWRVILDEAHAIKNKDSKTAKATFALSARSRWCLTGTPIQNSLDDLWSLLHFLHLPDFETKDWWNQYILRAVKSNFKPTQDRGFLRLQTILKPLLLRRVKDQTYRGKPILDLPPVTHHVQLSEFEAEEKIFYDGIWEKAKLSFKNLMRGDAEMTYMQVLEWLLRLRQACDHPYLVLKGQAGQIGSSSSLTGNLNDDDDGDKFAFKEMDEYEFLNKEYKTALRIFNDMARKKQRQPKDHDDSSFVGSLESMNEPRTPTKNTQLKLRDVVLSPSKKNPEASLHNICSLCQNALEEDAVCAPCRHQFCKECMDEWLEQNNSCPVCKISLKSAQLSSAGNMHCSPIPKGRPSFGGASTPMASTKIKALIAELVRLRPTGEKSIIFSQFTSYLDLVEVFLAKNGFKWTRLDGTMTQEQRADAIQTFKTKQDVNIFVVSLKAGGTGLNLTVASRVFLLDPWWNPCIDQQAIDRAHRLGQKRPVVVTRFLMKNSIEERIMELQEKKKALAQGALCPEKRESVSRLTIKDLKLLFRDF